MGATVIYMQKNTQNVTKLVQGFVVSVLNYSEFILKDSQTANRHYDEFIDVLKQLALHGEEGLIALAKLLDDDRIVVRVTAACYLVHFRTEKALSVLGAAANLEDRAISMLAIVTIKRWEKCIYLDPATGNEVKLTKI